MNLKESKQIFEDIADLCSSIGDHKLLDILESIYREVEDAETPYEVLELLGDLMFHVDEVSWDDEEVEDIKNEIQTLYNRLQDEIE